MGFGDLNVSPNVSPGPVLGRVRDVKAETYLLAAAERGYPKTRDRPKFNER